MSDTPMLFSAILPTYIYTLLYQSRISFCTCVIRVFNSHATCEIVMVHVNSIQYSVTRISIIRHCYLNNTEYISRLLPAL